MPRSPAPKPSRGVAPAPLHVALLRGINVGGRNMLPMAGLAEIFRRSGATGVQTYIASGNVLFAAPPGCAATEITRAASARILKSFGFEPRIVLRSAAQFAAVSRTHPFMLAEHSDADHARLHVGFCESAPARAAIARLDPDRSPGDRFLVRGQEIFIHYAHGAGKTRLTPDYFDATLGVQSTFRNWRTVRTLAGMLA